MTQPNDTNVKDVRLIVRVHIPAVSPFEVPDIQEGIRMTLTGYPNAEIEVSMVPTMQTR